MSRPRLRLVLAVLALAVMSCFRERERYDIPRLSLQITTPTVSPGGAIVIHVIAADNSGLTYFTVGATSERDTSRFAQSNDFRLSSASRTFFSGIDPQNFVAADSLDQEFTLQVSDIALLGSWVKVVATTIDNQNFQVVVTDSIRVQALTP